MTKRTVAVAGLVVAVLVAIGAIVWTLLPDGPADSVADKGSYSVGSNGDLNSGTWEILNASPTDLESVRVSRPIPAREIWPDPVTHRVVLLGGDDVTIARDLDGTFERVL